MESGCHFILNETQNHFDEIKIICNYCSKNKIPYVLSLSFDENYNLYSGENIGDILHYITGFYPLAIGINCVKPRTFLKFIDRYNINYNWGFYLNCGKGEFNDVNIVSGVTPNVYLRTIKKTLIKSPSFVGACCGSTPAHIKMIKEFLDGKHNN
jgi:homocysteine S-methyltransferase